MTYVVVFDTNILISAWLSKNSPTFSCLSLAKTGSVSSVTCQEILDELSEKLQQKFQISERGLREYINEFIITGFGINVHCSECRYIIPISISRPNQNKGRPKERMAFNLTKFGLSHGFTFTHAILEILIKLGHNFGTGIIFSIPKTGYY